MSLRSAPEIPFGGTDISKRKCALKPGFNVFMIHRISKFELVWNPFSHATCWGGRWVTDKNFTTAFIKLHFHFLVQFSFSLCLLTLAKNRWKQLNATKYVTRSFYTSLLWGKYRISVQFCRNGSVDGHIQGKSGN